MTRGVAVVTGGSSGIGAACVRRLAAEGFEVVAGARPVVLDVTDDASVAELVADLGPCRLLVNNAGGALGLRSVADADLEEWRAMYESNVLGTVRLTRALLPRLEASGDGHVVTIGSIAAHEPYPGGAGYNAAKFAVRATMSVLRQEVLGRPIRVTEIDPGMVETEFSLVRFGGDADRAAKVYEGVTPLTADDIADCVAFVATRPSHVNIDSLVVMARDQAGARQVHRHP